MAGDGITELLIEWSGGDKGALDRLMPLVYEELRTLARHYLSLENPGHTLPGTALVHEAYLRLVDQDRVQWRDRAHFFGVAAGMIRRILVDHARKSHAEKRGGAAPRLALDEAVAASPPRDLDLVALDDALNALANLDPEQSRVVELRFFAGMTTAEIAEALAISPSTVQRNWVTAKAWLFDELSQRGADIRSQP
jgi:RNA polymerase sigma factor (TIGR02999 family)